MLMINDIKQEPRKAKRKTKEKSGEDKRQRGRNCRKTDYWQLEETSRSCGNLREKNRGSGAGRQLRGAIMETNSCHRENKAIGASLSRLQGGGG